MERKNSTNFPKFAEVPELLREEKTESSKRVVSYMDWLKKKADEAKRSSERKSGGGGNVLGGEYSLETVDGYSTTTLPHDAAAADVAAAQIVEQVKEATASPDSVNKTIAIKVLTPNVALRKMFGRFILGENRDRYYPEKDE